ncbi:MAG TPA: hypothetical protein P5567_06545 [Kiritimatiellia bacterium]|nr:hypothetical protein [Kiritimatiellia bacterium]HRZ12096.1 hypothetical protein [Kiritimatiellia bacterium]HSA18146.1 hypothetical protein [Kiritimatiellia bacterium]
MNCETTRNRILLDQSRELSRVGRWLLAGHLARCPECRAYRAGLTGLAGAVRQVRWDESFDAGLAGRVAAGAAVPAPRAKRGRERAPVFLARPALAYGALSVLLALAFVLILRPFQRPPPLARTAPDSALAWDADVDDRLATLDVLVNQDDADWTETSGAAADSGDVDSIARQLLELEGEQI